jgi:hypothetical protein
MPAMNRKTGKHGELSVCPRFLRFLGNGRLVGVALGKADVVKQWKPGMKALGFTYRGNMFQFVETTDQYLQFAISIQKNLHSDTYLIHHSVLIRSPFVTDSRRDVLVDGSLRSNGIHLHCFTDSWWPRESLPKALDLLKRLALPWFREWGNAAFLIEKVEIAIRDRKHLINIFEPLTQEQEEAITQVWHRPADPNWRIPAMTFYYASILHYLAGNREMAITRTRDWLERLGPQDKAEKDRAQAQLTFLKRIH